MKKTFIILIVTYGLFLIECVISEVLGLKIKPNLLIISVVFFNLTWGIRWSLVAAFFAGMLKDSFGISILGFYTFSFLMSAYLTTLIKFYLYQTGSRASRVFIVFLICFLNATILYFLKLMSTPIDLYQSILQIVIPEIITTTLVTTFVIQKLSQCVSKLYV